MGEDLHTYYNAALTDISVLSSPTSVAGNLIIGYTGLTDISARFGLSSVA